MDFKNPEHRERELQRMKDHCVECPALPGKNVEGDCWVPPKRIPDGTIINAYISAKLQGETMTLHRKAWILAHGAYPPLGLVVMHECDRKPCCNPDHLRLGTSKENFDDAIARGLFDPKCPKGKPRPWLQNENNVPAKASDRLMAEIKWLMENS